MKKSSLASNFWSASSMHLILESWEVRLESQSKRQQICYPAWSGISWIRLSIQSRAGAELNKSLTALFTALMVD
jgi:hypothetical protein